MKRLVLGIGVLSLGLLFAAGAVAALAFVLRPGPTAPPARVLVSPDAAASFDRKLAGLDSRSTTTITLTEEELTSKLIQLLESDPAALPVSDLQVRLRTDQIEATGRVDLGFARPHLGTAIRLRVDNGALHGGIQRLSLEGIPVPSGFTTQLVAFVFRAAGLPQPSQETDLSDFSGFTVPRELQDLHIEEGQMVIVLRPSDR